MAKKKLLMTGGTGFVGSATLLELMKNSEYEVFALTRGNREIEFPAQAHIVKADMDNFRMIDELIDEIKPDMIFHGAWFLSHNNWRHGAGNLDSLASSVNILRAFLRNKGERFIFLGSLGEYSSYGVNALGRYMGSMEDGPERSDMLYGVTKRAFGDILKQSAESWGFQFCHIRLGSVYGAKCNVIHAAAAAAAAFLRGKEFVCNAPNNLWDWLYIDDAARDLTSLVFSDFCGTVNLCSGNPLLARDFFINMAKLTGTPELLRFNNDDIPGKVFFGNIERMNAVLKNPSRTPLKKGLELMLNEMKTVL